MRLFIAVPLPQELTDRAAALLPPTLPALRRVRPELMHVTLAFLGRIADERLADVIAATRAAATGAQPFALALTGVGRFPASGLPRVVWLGVGAGQQPLAALAGRVIDELRGRTISFDDRPFEPHLTLARLRVDASGPERRTVAAAIDALDRPELRTVIDRIWVLESLLSPNGPRYTTRGEALLG